MNTFWSYKYINTPSELGRYSFDTIFSTGLLLYINWIISSSASSSILSLQVIFVFKLYSSLDLDHHSIWIFMGHHHWIWIITRSRSSLDLDHHWSSLLELDHHSIWIIIDRHHWIWIITRSGSSLGIITGSRSSLDLDLDHHSIWIITGAISWFFSWNFYRASPFSCWL